MKSSDFVPPILYRIKKRFIKRYRPIKIDSMLDEITVLHNRACVMGNGPSLNPTLEKYKDKLCQYDIVVVNYFALTPYFKELKPRLYVLADPMFWGMLESAIESVEKLYQTMVMDVDWDLFLAMPINARGTAICDVLQSNSKIHVVYYNSRDYCAVSSDQMRNEAWSKNLICPPVQTVVNTALYVAIFKKYEEIYLVGADSSFIEDIRVNQENNRLYTVDKHFYSNSSVYKGKFFDGNIRYLTENVPEEFMCEYRAFKAYWDLRSFAEYQNVKVYNACEYSWIDAYDRKKIV